MLERDLIDQMFPADLPEPSYWERLYPPRQLPEGAQITRFGPSPTGYVHVGNIYVAMIDQNISNRTGGAYLVRIEDTDQSRAVSGAVEQLQGAFEFFGIRADEDDTNGAYGPYLQSARERIYLSYVGQLMRTGQAYPCFATHEELAEITRRQQATKLPTGYYGSWAIWRDADPGEVAARLAAGDPYVVRFRSPGVEGRVSFEDAIRGRLEHEVNRNDVVILKSSTQSPRLPTYHLAHAVDDHLMRVNLVIRGEEWISSVPLHLQLFTALGFEPPTYAHIAPLMKIEGGNKRKLSKRKDPEASVDFYLDTGYPAAAVLYYLRGLANGRLAELPLAQALEEPIRLADCGVAGPLVDMVKLADISGDHLATLSGPAILDAVCEWAAERDPELVSVIGDNRELAERVIDVERVGVDNPRKDLVRWSDFRALYGFFFPSLFTPVTDPSDQRLGGLDAGLVRKLTADFADHYTWSEKQPEWFAQVRELAARHGFAPNPKAYKKDPDAYPGMLRDAANVIRVAITGSSRSPDLHQVCGALGADEVTRRVRALAG
ncbi:MAG: glutamate--tRNA ligase family protein [Actinomycetota bacterium]|nr:glutamate--tRNA ligase family protein [Actinomycetota bacterium]